MQVLKNIQFTQLIKINRYLKEFNFRKPNGSLESVFTVDTLDERHQRITFNMKLNGSDWKIVQSNLPVWINENEKNLHDVIFKVLESTDVYVFIPEQNSHWHMSRLLNIFGFN